MDPHPTPFAGKRRSVAASAKAAVPKPKSITAARAKIAKKSPTMDAPQPRPRRAFGNVRTNNALAEKPPPPAQKPAKVSPPPAQKTVKVSPAPAQKSTKVSPPPPPKSSKLSPPNLARAIKPSRPAVKPLKKTAPATELEPKARKKNQRVSFQGEPVTAVATGSGEKVNSSTVESAGRTPKVKSSAGESAGRTPKMKASTGESARRTPTVKASAGQSVGRTPKVKVQEKEKAKAVAEETPFFTAQNFSNCSLDPLEDSTYWLAQIHLAESVGKHRVAAAFFHLAFECEAQPTHRILSELKTYAARHESANTMSPLFDDLLLGHGMSVDPPIFDDGFEKVDTPLTTNQDGKKLGITALNFDECVEGYFGDDAGDVASVGIVKPLEGGVDQPSFERKLDKSFEFDDSEAIIVDTLVDPHSNVEKRVTIEASCDSEPIQPACRPSIDNLSLKGSPAVSRSSQKRLSSDSPLTKLSPSARSLSAKRLSSGSTCDKKSPFGSSSKKRLASSCPSSKKPLSIRDLSSKQMSSSGHPHWEHDSNAVAYDLREMIEDLECEYPAIVDQLELNEDEDAAAVNEINEVLKLEAI